MTYSNKSTQHAFLLCMAGIYMFAFTSIYFQIPGLYGKNGLLPAHLQLQGRCEDKHSDCSHWLQRGECQHNPIWMNNNCQVSCKQCEKGEPLALSAKFKKTFTLLWFGQHLGLPVEIMMELLCFVGMILSFAILVSNQFCNQIVFASLWLSYFSLYKVGQTFLSFQWDILLLEAGFITIILSPLKPNKEFKRSQCDNVIFWLVKWLLFRLMIASGVVKLTSMCPTWWGLTALDWHYESQCIPTPLAWYAHQMPGWFQKLSVVATYVIEIGIPFLFFAPVRSLRIFAFYSQLLLQLLIILSGNYNFFNLLTCTLCLSIIDDTHMKYMKVKCCKVIRCSTFYLFTFKNENEIEIESISSSRWVKVTNIGKQLVFYAVLLNMFYWTKILFNLKIGEGYEVLSNIGFTQNEFTRTLTSLTEVSIIFGILSLCIELLKMVYRTLQNSIGSFQLSMDIAKIMGASLFSIWLFSLSLVPFTGSLDRNIQGKIWPVVQNWNTGVESYEIANSYGLFRSMTGVGGRPELIIEGTDNLNGKWKEYNFLYKPGNVTRPLPFIFPHQPRLDWQMWFAALGSYRQNPWFIHLIYKLLHGEESVLLLLDENPFPKQPPKYIRSMLYTYHYTRIPKNTKSLIEGFQNSRTIKNWWKREKPKEYTPPLHKDEPTLINYIKENGWFKKEDKMQMNFLHGLFINLRSLIVTHLPPHVFMLQLAILALFIRQKFM